GVILAIVIFVPLTAKLTSCIKTDEDAKKSFMKLAEDMRNLGPDATPLKLDLDKNTAVVAFPINPATKCDMPRPLGCKTGEPCLCLFKKVDLGKEKFEDEICEKIPEMAKTNGILRSDWVGTFKTGDNDACQYFIINPRTIFFYGQQSSSGIKLCAKLEGNSCLSQSEKENEIIAGKIKTELRKLDGHSDRPGVPFCSLGFLNLEFMPAGSVLTIEGFTDSDGKEKTKYSAKSESGISITGSEQVISVPFCNFNLDVQSSGSNKVEITRYVSEDPAFDPGYTVNDYIDQKKDKPLLIKLDKKVCIATHDRNTKYLYDQDQGTVFTDAGNFVVQMACPYTV
ncbi:MAG: hypothetical protein AABX51_00890, partial [Nanoarchaeota archaeon]